VGSFGRFRLNRATIDHAIDQPIEHTVRINRNNLLVLARPT
jgi:hypothetical protein